MFLIFTVNKIHTYRNIMPSYDGGAVFCRREEWVNGYNVLCLLLFIFVILCIVILGWRNRPRCNSMQIFIYC